MIGKPAKAVTPSVDPDEAPPWTDEQIVRADLAVGGEVVRKGQGTLSRPRGRPKPSKPKQHVSLQQHVSLRLEADVIDAYRATGPGWQARMAQILRQAVGR